MTTLVIKTNAAQGTEVLIGDLGISVPASGGQVSLTTREEVTNALDSDDLLELATDDAHGVDSSTLILNNGTIDIDQDDVTNFLQTANLPLSGAFSVVLRDRSGLQRDLARLADGGGPMEVLSGAYREILPSADPFPTSIIWWESSSKLNKIVEKTLTYTGPFPTTIEWKVYDTDGTTVLATVTDSITYSGPFETNRTRTIS